MGEGAVTHNKSKKLYLTYFCFVSESHEVKSIFVTKFSFKLNFFVAFSLVRSFGVGDRVEINFLGQLFHCLAPLHTWDTDALV